MKNLAIAVVSVLCLGLGLTACGGDSGSDSKSGHIVLNSVDCEQMFTRMSNTGGAYNAQEVYSKYDDSYEYTKSVSGNSDIYVSTSDTPSYECVRDDQATTTYNNPTTYPTTQSPTYPTQEPVYPTQEPTYQQPTYQQPTTGYSDETVRGY